MEKKEVVCQIEHQATLFALISKRLHEEMGDDAKEIILEATTVYGRERGIRMAKNALANGDEINVITSQAYGEWIPNYQGQMEFGFMQGEPTLQTYISKCAWCAAWEKHDLLEYGKFYCDVVDNAVYQGFDSRYTCTTLADTMSYGGKRCEFDWELAMTESDFEELKAKKEQLGNRFKKDFNFHTAHILEAVGRTVCERAKEVGEKAVNAGIADYINLFGREYYDILLTVDRGGF